MKWLVFLFILTGCNHHVKLQEAAEHYCEPCGGLDNAIMGDQDLLITCKNGKQLSHRWFTIDQPTLVIGECK
jgi:hypothetical protein